MTSKELQQYFWVTLAQRVLPKLNRTIGVWEADKIQIDLSSLPLGAFVNVYQNFQTATNTTAAHKLTVVSLAGDWWYLDQNSCGTYHQNGWACTYNQTLYDASWTPEQREFLVGGETAMWGEGINQYNADAYIWRGAAAAAERLWSPLELTPSYVGALGRYPEHLCRLHILGVHAGPIAPGFCPADVHTLPSASGAARYSAAGQGLKHAALAAVAEGRQLELSLEQARELLTLL